MQNHHTKIVNEIPIFPLPNTVFFPKTLLPLHVFEPRYRRMVEDARKTENLIGVVLLKDGWENDYFGSPDVHDIGSVGKIEYLEKLRDGKFNILLYGLRRVKILDFVQDEPYRVARVEYVKDVNFDHDSFYESYEAEKFLGLVESYFTERGIDNLNDFLKLGTHSLESIINQVASVVDFSTQSKQNLLEIGALEQRYEKLTRLLHTELVSLKVAKQVKYVPHDPSWN